MGDNVTNTDRDISYLPETMTRYEPGLQTPGQLLSSHAPRLVSQCFKQHFHTKSGRILTSGLEEGWRLSKDLHFIF